MFNNQNCKALSDLQKKFLTSLWNRGPLKILNGIKLILDDQFGIIQVLQRSPNPQTSELTGTFCCFLQQTALTSNKVERKFEVFFHSNSLVVRTEKPV